LRGTGTRSSAATRGKSLYTLLVFPTTAIRDYLQLRTVAAAKDFLVAGFTSARDLGAVFGMKRAIDVKGMPGPIDVHTHGTSARYRTCC